jgi:hypothetical protein
MRSLGALGVALLAAFAAACGSEVTIYHQPAGGNGGAGGTTPTSSTTNPTTTETSPTSSGTGGGPSCVRTHDWFEMQLDDYEGLTWGCEGGAVEEGTNTLAGQVVESFDAGLVLDSCPPNADCMPMLSKLGFSAPGLFNPVPQGAFVAVTVRVEMPWGCSHELLIVNLPTWAGMPNPVDSTAKAYLLAADGAPEAPPGSPITVKAEPAGCSSGEEGDDYRLHFSTSQPNEDLILLMGQSEVWEVDAGLFMQGRNLRSFETGYADDTFDWGYYLVDLQLVGEDDGAGGG